MSNATSIYDTIVIGGGQAGLSVGYFLKQQGRDFVILDANERVGDAWRKRWDSLRLFTPARYDELPGMRFPAPAHTFPTKDEMADYLESYAARFELPVRTGVRVYRLFRNGTRFTLTAGEQRFEAEHVVVAMGNWQKPRVPAFARQLDPGITQLHSTDYHNPTQLRPGGVLVVGAGNSGAEIALEAARDHAVWLSGRDTGHIPFRIDGLAARLLLVRLVLRFGFHHLLTVDRVSKERRAKHQAKGQSLVRIKPKDLAAAGIERVPRTAGVRDGRPELEDGHVLDVANVIWCTGYDPGLSWIDLPIFEKEGLSHDRGVSTDEPGLYFVGLYFQYAVSSAMIQGVGRDAAYIARVIAASSTAPAPAAAARSLAAS